MSERIDELLEAAAKEALGVAKRAAEADDLFMAQHYAATAETLFGLQQTTMRPAK